MKSCRYKARDMSDISHEDCAASVGSFPELLKVDRSSVSGSACDDQLRLCLYRDPLELVIVDEAVLIHAVRNDIEVSAGDVGSAAVCEMAALIEVHAHQSIAGL